ncbi:hypothetical protein AXA84_0197 [Candidatus Phytoplasma oryzae]|uniref:Uncharacterized protein n=1 Tax=Candidatus Phytoplasma oryzae TaxID=203274 RepID=A0A139JQQ4_9MOLU|nr:hypothetical protein [Candidatus Phytoplasma oryzae]KXT29303.1 hypothetical protein AXA84_0197 [Candidatus Phytoplasma oryzae]RAM57566.1 hypothetical protein DH96_02360 [Candidatus Phytoplasma oryzae]
MFNISKMIHKNLFIYISWISIFVFILISLFVPSHVFASGLVESEVFNNQESITTPKLTKLKLKSNLDLNAPSYYISKRVSLLNAIRTEDIVAKVMDDIRQKLEVYYDPMLVNDFFGILLSSGLGIKPWPYRDIAKITDPEQRRYKQMPMYDIDDVIVLTKQCALLKCKLLMNIAQQLLDEHSFVETESLLESTKQNIESHVNICTLELFWKTQQDDPDFPNE